jgi:dihydroorotase
VILEAVRLAHDSATVVDVELREGVVADVRPSHSRQSDLIVLPAFVDLHTHLREPGGEAAEDIASGTRAAAAGGYSDVFAMPNTIPAVDTVEQVRRQRKRSVGAAARVHPIAAATVGRRGDRLVDIRALRDEGVQLFSDDGSCLDDATLVEELLTILAERGGIFAQHAQSRSLAGSGVANARVADRLGVSPWPTEGEEAVIARDIALVERVGGALHICHLSTAGSVELVRGAKRRGLPVTAEVTPHHLLLTDDLVRAETGRFKVNPPLRSAADVEALRAGLRDGTIDVVATDHAPHPPTDKERPLAVAAFGFTGLETALPIVADVFAKTTNIVDWKNVARVMSVEPARLGGVQDLPDEVTIGAPATLTVVRRGVNEIVTSSRQLTRSNNTPLEGRSMSHRVELTMVHGVVSFRRDEVKGRPN